MRYDELCAHVTATIVNTIESGHAGTWRAPWHHNGTSGLFSPTNAATGRPYAGANILLLAIDALEAGYADNTWATYKQWQQLGGQVRRGEHGTRCVKWITKTNNTDQRADTSDEQRQVLIPRVFTVFNVAQVADYEPATIDDRAAPDRIETAEAFIAATGANVDSRSPSHHRGSEATNAASTGTPNTASSSASPGSPDYAPANSLRSDGATSTS